MYIVERVYNVASSHNRHYIIFGCLSYAVNNILVYIHSQAWLVWSRQNHIILSCDAFIIDGYYFCQSAKIIIKKREIHFPASHKK